MEAATACAFIDFVLFATPHSNDLLVISISPLSNIINLNTMGKPRLIVLVRHAQSEGNLNRSIHQIVPDHRVKLTDEGWKQVQPPHPSHTHKTPLTLF